MTQEEKATAYDKAVEKIKYVMEHGVSPVLNKEDLQDIFPQLKESEDEKIRKSLISAINNICKFDEGLATFNGFSKGQVLAWLEKQGEQKSADKCEGCNNAKGCVACVDGNEWAHIEEQKPFDYENATIIQKDFAPKFKIGDWVVFNNKHQSIYQVEKIEDGYYILRHTHGGTFRVCVLHDKSLRLWTIQDAKDGDVLHSTGFHNDCIFIFNGLDNWRFDEPNGDRAVATGYCCLFVSADNMEFGMQGPDCIEVNTVKPATKIQHDLLFTKMKEAGYEWNAEKKELKKIEPTPAWSKEDEGMLRRCISATFDHGYLRECDWLKSLKDRVGCEVNCTTTKEWSEEDALQLNEAIEAVNESSYSSKRKDVVIDWLKSLKGRVGNFDDGYKVGFSAAKHNQWKPSDEQMKAIRLARSFVTDDYFSDNPTLSEILIELENQLKKLREE